ncbi:MAG TPA: hypothetical protein VM123_13100 [archaeon]|nr:hypothetical protein [archaeon]
MCKSIKNINAFGLSALFLFCCTGLFSAETVSTRHPVSREHPRLLGTAGELKELARQKPGDFVRVAEVAFEQEGDDHQKMISMGLLYAIKGDQWYGKKAVEIAMRYINGPVRVGHETFGHDLARCALAYDLCYPCWSAEERMKFHDYLNRTVDANLGSETSVFHNGWYGYKSWGIGLACYATYYENPRSPEILKALENEFRERVVPSFALAGDGGGWAEGYYVNYWSYEWMFFCEVARRCEGMDYFDLSPEFLGNRAVAGMFEAYPGIRERDSRRPVPMGDSGGRVFTGERDKALSARRILVNFFRDDPAHQVVHSFNETTPVSGVVANAYKDFLWRDTSVKKGNLKNFRLSHISQGPGYVYARSSWDEDATYFFFKCGDRFTSHQHLDVGNFLIYKYEELAGDGGQFYAFDTDHEVNYLLRTIAHNSILVHDPGETWPAIRAFKGPIGNDGGQHHNWPHHNGSVQDAAAWVEGRKLYDIADMLAFEDRGGYLYVAGDCSRAYSPKKLEYFFRQIVFIRPGTFVIFDRVRSKDPGFEKTWLLQAMKPPTGEAPSLQITNGRGRLFVQILLPLEPRVKLFSGPVLYSYGGRSYPPYHNVGPAPECRIEVSPPVPAEVDYFLNVLTAADSSTVSVPQAAAEVTDSEVTVTVAGRKIVFTTQEVGGGIEVAGRRTQFAKEIVAQ